MARWSTGSSRSRTSSTPHSAMTGTTSETHIGCTGMTGGMTVFFAAAGAVAVGNLYWAQPLLAEAFGIPLGQSGMLITVTQLGYAIGVLLLVPLGDTLNRRMTPTLMGISVLALVASALAPNYWALLGGVAAVGVTSLSGQLLLPLASDLARDDQRGRVIGTIASGLLIGIMLSRLVSGFMADAFGWQAIYFAAAVVNAMFAVVLLSKLPNDRPRASLSYGEPLAWIAGAVTPATGIAFGLALISLGTAAAGSTSIIFVVLAIVLLNLATQSVNVLNQTRLLTIRPELRSRLNTAFVFCNFLAGAAGSALAGTLWQAGGWCFSPWDRPPS
jgi:predicted MFS family arabinose efflux permease